MQESSELAPLEELPSEILSSTARTRSVVRALNLTSKTVRNKIRSATLDVCKEPVTEDEILNYFTNPDPNHPAIILTASINGTEEPGNNAVVIYISLRDKNDIVYYWQATYLLETQQIDQIERSTLSVLTPFANLINLKILPPLHEEPIFLPNNYILSPDMIVRIIN